MTPETVFELGVCHQAEELKTTGKVFCHCHALATNTCGPFVTAGITTHAASHTYWQPRPLFESYSFDMTVPNQWRKANKVINSNPVSFLTSPSMYFSRQMAQSEVELLLSESEAPQLLSRWPFPLALNFLVSIFSKAWMAILFMELCGGEEGGTGSAGISARSMRHASLLKDPFQSSVELVPKWDHNKTSC